MRSEKKTNSSVLFVLLIYVFMAGNTSGELALCIGANWHVAIEPLCHEHNHNNPHIEQKSPSSRGHEHEEQLKSPHCKPCIDIPLFVGHTDNRLPLKQVKLNMDTLVSLTNPAAIRNYEFIPSVIPRQYSPTTDENRFLRSVIMLV